jgi:hypothetical protein
LSYPTGTIISCETLQSYMGVVGMMQHHYRIDNDPFGLADLPTIHALITLPLSDTLKFSTSDQSEIIACKTFEVTTPTTYLSSHFSTFGMISGDHKLPFVCYTVKLSSDVWNHRGGYKHLMGVPSVAVIDGVFDPAFVAGHNQYPHFLSHVPSFFGLQLSLVVYSRPSIALPSGGYTRIRSVDYQNVSTQNSRTGRANASLIAAFA